MAEILASLKKKGGGGAEFILTVTYTEDYYGATITATDGTTTLTATATSSGEVEFTIPNEGSWTVSTTVDGTTISQQIDVIEEYEVEFPIPTPDGATVTPVNNIQTWLKCAGITDKSYTTFFEVVNDVTTYEALLADSNACEYLVRSTDWIGAEQDLVPTMTSNTQPSGECFSSVTESSSYKNYYPFDGVDSTAWATTQSGTSYIGYKFDSAVVVNKVYFDCKNYYSRTTSVKVQASNDNFVNDIHDLSEAITPNEATTTILFNNTTSYQYYRLAVTAGSGIYYTIQFYYYNGITVNEKAMSYLGKYDYACKTLLSNILWRTAIINSDYWERILNVSTPNMTSATAPSGTVSASSTISSSYAPYKAFHPCSGGTDNWIPNATTGWLQYEFPNPVIINMFHHGTSVDGSFDQNPTATNRAWTGNLQGSNNGITWTTIIETIDAKGATNNGQCDIYIDFANTQSFKYYRLNVTSATTAQPLIANVKLWGRASHMPDDIPMVPVMTSNTTPSGEVLFDNGQTSGGSSASLYYVLFDNTASQVVGVSNNTQWQYFGYDFGNPVKINKVGIYGYYTTGTVGIKVQGYNGSDWVDVADLGTYTQSQSWKYFSFDNNNSYSKWRFYCTKGTATSIAFFDLQFYAYSTQTDIIHSAANDTVYYLDELNNPTILCTTDSGGIGYCDLTALGEGVHTFISSVSKDPSSLENYYSKQILITDTVYGHRTELYLMPDTVKTLYWYGLKSPDMETLTTANGWTSYVDGTVTFNTNDAGLASNAGIGTKGSISFSKIHTICKTTAFKSGSTIGVTLRTNSTKNGNSSNYVYQSVTNTIQHLEIEPSSGHIYAYVNSVDGRTGSAYALWYE